MDKNYIYLVIESYGEYEDHHEYIVKAFKYEEDAKNFAKEIDKTHSTEYVIDQDIWDQIISDYIEEYDKLYEANEFDNPFQYDTPESRKRFDEITEKENKLKLECAKKYDKNITIELIKEQEHIINNIYMDYYPCTVQKIEYQDYKSLPIF